MTTITSLTTEISTSMANQPPVHLCIATGQNAANLIPLEQRDASEIWILQTPRMLERARHLKTALEDRKLPDRVIALKEFDDTSTATMICAADAIAEQLDGRHVVLHVTGGTKMMVLLLRDGLRMVETGGGRLELIYADTAHQHIDIWGSSSAPEAEPMADVLSLKQLLLVQGYRIEGDNRHEEALKRSEPRARLTQTMAEGAKLYKGFFSALATLGVKASEGGSALQQVFDYAPGGSNRKLMQQISDAGLVEWVDGEPEVRFTSIESARYLAGAWLEEYVLLKLKGIFRQTDRFSSNLRIISADHKVSNEIDAMVVHRNRVLLIECKTGKQHKAQEAIYKLAQLSKQLGGTVAQPVYLSAQALSEADSKRAEEYGVKSLHGQEVGQLVDYIKTWQANVR